MSDDLERARKSYEREIFRLTGREECLDAEVLFGDQRLAGLRDFRTILELATVRLKIALLAVEQGQDGELARSKAIAALQLLDDLRGLSLSDDQSEVIRGSPEFTAAQAELELFLIAGGAALLEDRVADEARIRKLARIVAAAVSKHVYRDDTYQALFRTERLREPLRLLVKAFLPALAPEHQAEPPYGLEEGEEEVRRTPRMTVPLPQAIHYLSEELLPAYRDALDADPGDTDLQASIRTLKQRIGRLRTLRVYPRSMSLKIEPGIQTETFVGFTADGVPLVTIAIGVEVCSGTNLERMQDLIRSEVVRRCAGGGFAPELDREYRSLALAGGDYRTGTRAPSLRLDHRRLFPALCRAFPALYCVEDRTELKRLLEHCYSYGERATRQLIETSLVGSEQAGAQLPGSVQASADRP